MRISFWNELPARIVKELNDNGAKKLFKNGNEDEFTAMMLLGELGFCSIGTAIAFYEGQGMATEQITEFIQEKLEKDEAETLLIGGISYIRLWD